MNCEGFGKMIDAYMVFFSRHIFFKLSSVELTENHVFFVSLGVMFRVRAYFVNVIPVP